MILEGFAGEETGYVSENSGFVREAEGFAGEETGYVSENSGHLPVRQELPAHCMGNTRATFKAKKPKEAVSWRK